MGARRRGWPYCKVPPPGPPEYASRIARGANFPRHGHIRRMLLRDPHSVSIYLRLLGFVRPYWRLFTLSIVAMLALAATEWMLPALLKPLIDRDFELAGGTQVYLTPVLLVGLFALRGLLSYAGTVSLHWVAQRTIMDLRARMFQTLARLPAPFFDAHGAGELISKFTFDVTQLAQATTRVLTVLIKDSAVIVVLLSYLFYLNWRLALFLLFFAPPIGFIVGRVSRRMRDTSRRLQDSVGEINQVAEEAIRGQREIKVFDGFAYEAARFADAINGARKFHMKVVQTSAIMVPLIQLIVALGIGMMIVFALREAAAGGMTRGDFIAFVTATALLLPPTKRLAAVNEFLQRGIAASESVFGLIDAEVESDGGSRTDRPRGDLTFENINVIYGERTALSDVCLHIKAGESIALVGRSGAGKTTLANLVPRFYEPTAGQLLLDGRPISEWSLPALRAHIAYVGQNIVLFNDSIFNNIAYGANASASAAAVEAAAEQAQVLAFAADLAEGLHTPVGENGLRLSGGQRQRVAIARALLKNAPILILDEATAALDNEAERLVQGALETLRQGRTSLTVAHRLSTIVQADRIVVLENGRIVETGAHQQLVDANGAYARLYAAGFDAM